MSTEVVKYTIIIIEKLQNAFLVKCGYCGGSGKDPRPWKDKAPCPTCEGAGKVLLRIPTDWDCDIGISKCAYCNGKGKDPRSWEDRKPCPVCHGVGAEVKCFPRIQCSYCNGTGEDPRWWKDKQPCPKCGGVGSIWIERLKVY